MCRTTTKLNLLRYLVFLSVKYTCRCVHAHVLHLHEFTLILSHVCICNKVNPRFFPGIFSLWLFLDEPKPEPFIEAEQRCVLPPLVLHVLYTSGELQLGWYGNMLCIHDISGAQR